MYIKCVFNIHSVFINISVIWLMQTYLLTHSHTPNHGHIIDIFLPGLKHSKVENPFYISAYTSILDPNQAGLQPCQPLRGVRLCSYWCIFTSILEN